MESLKEKEPVPVFKHTVFPEHWHMGILSPMRTEKVAETLITTHGFKGHRKLYIIIFSGASLGGVPIRMLVTNCAPRPRLQVLAMCQPLKKQCNAEVNGVEDEQLRKNVNMPAMRPASTD
jgi:hypothetical protein